VNRRRLFLLAAAPLLTRAIRASAAPAPVRRILRLATGRVDRVPLEEYVAAVLPAEIGPALPAALEAQAVAARSYAIGKGARHETDGADLCDGTHCQVYRGMKGATPASRRATEATRGLVLVQAGRVIPAPFHACCGGRTARPVDVWDDEEVPDLPSVGDDACPEADWSFHLPRTLLPVIGAPLGFPDARYLEVYGRSGDGRVSMVRLAAPGGVRAIVRGFEFRQAAMALWGASSIRSTAFELEETRTEYVLRGRGRGHGAGLCQDGAIARARRGEGRAAILGLYYRGATIAPLAGLA